jgi:hypothetical protein
MGRNYFQPERQSRFSHGQGERLRLKRNSPFGIILGADEQTVKLPFSNDRIIYVPHCLLIRPARSQSIVRIDIPHQDSINRGCGMLLL